MKALDCIFSRRSIRAYDLDRQVEQEKIDNLLKAGCSAPSSCNGRPWTFVVIKDRDTIEKLSKLSPYYIKPLNTAPMAIAVLANKMPSNKIVKPLYHHQDCAAATQNILLAAAAQNLGTCWMGGMLEEEEAQKAIDYLKIPEDKFFFSLISLGYPKEEKEVKGIIDEDKVFFETL